MVSIVKLTRYIYLIDSFSASRITPQHCVMRLLFLIFWEYVWISGPYRTGELTEVLIFRDNLKKLLGPGVCVIMNSFYPHEHWLQSQNCIYESKKIHKLIRAGHETLNDRIKTFRVLSTCFRHNHNIHKFFFHAVMHKVKLILHERPLFQL